MKTNLKFKYVLFFSFFSSILNAQLIMNENFEYATGALAGTYKNWVETNSQYTMGNPLTVATPIVPAILYNNYPSSGIGNELPLSSSGPDAIRTFTTQKNTTIYLSALVYVTGAGSGDYFINLYSSSVSELAYACVFIKLGSNNIYFGISNTIKTSSGNIVYGSGTPVYTQKAYSLRASHLIVLKLDINTGEAAVIVDPTINNLEPLSTEWLKNSSGTDNPSSYGINGICIRQGNGNNIAATLRLDGIRIATSWSDLIPYIQNVTGVTLNKSTTSINVGSTETLTATIAPTTATNKNVTWSSSNTSVATVDLTGKITAVAVGTATITVTTADQSKTAQCVVTVLPKSPKHVWSFDSGVVDEEGGLTGVLMNGATRTNYSLNTTNGGYFSMPANQIGINSYSGLTTEIWFTSSQGQNTGFTMLSYFGNTTGTLGYDYYFVSAARGDDVSRTAISVGDQLTPWLSESGAIGTEYDDGKLHQMVSVVTDTTIFFYIDGFNYLNKAILNSNNKISNISSNLAYLCKGGYSADPTWKGYIHKFSIYNSTLSEMEVLNLFQNGPGLISGLNDPTKEFNTTLYPNPTSGKVLIESDLIISKIEVYSIDGRLILQKTSNNLNYIDISVLKEGSYLFKLFSSDSVINRKIIKK